MGNSILDEQYLKRPIIDATYIITPDKICIYTGHTCYVNVQRNNKFIKSQVMDRYSHLIKMAREKQFKISYTRHTKRELESIWAEYEKQCEVVDEIYIKMIKNYTILKSRGLHSGTSDDMYLQECNQLMYKYQTYFYRSAPIGKVMDLVSHINELFDIVQQARPSTRHKIYL